MSEKMNIETLAELGAMIRKARQDKGLTLDDVAAATGISKPYLSNIETARAPGPASDGKLRLLEVLLGFSGGALVEAAHWLRTPASVRARLGGLGAEMPRRADGTQDLDALWRARAGQEAEAGAGPKQDKARGGMGVKQIPLINRVPAGVAMEYTDLDYPVGVADRYLPVAVGAGEAAGAGQEAGGSGSGEEAAFALKVVGDSMEPEYRAGDILIVGRGEAREGDDCLVRLGEAENFATTFKRVFFVYGDAADGEKGAATAVRLVALNRKYRERQVGVEGISSIYPVLWKMTPAAGRAGVGGTVATEKSANKDDSSDVGAKTSESRFFSDFDLAQD